MVYSQDMILVGLEAKPASSQTAVGCCCHVSSLDETLSRAKLIGMEDPNTTNQCLEVGKEESMPYIYVNIYYIIYVNRC